MRLKLQNKRKTATGSRRWFSRTLMAAYLILGLVIWQTIHVVGGGELPFKNSSKPQIRSTKLHTDRDATSRKNRTTVDPVAAFFERAKRGMTEQEIRGIIADFEVIGPKPSSGELAVDLDYAKKLNDWYFKLLVEGLSLSYEQKREVWASLNERFDRNQLESNASLSADAIEFLMVLPMQNIAGGLNFQSGNSCADPWSLTNLTEDQLTLTYKKSLEAKYEARRKEEMKNPHGCRSCHSEHLLIMHDPATGEYIDYPTITIVLGSFMPGAVAGGIIDVTNTFPLTPDQKLENHRGDILAQAKLLHPAQLRMALLINQGVAKTLKYELDKPE